MAARIFVDTNVFLYAIDEGVPKKQERARHWREELWKARQGRTSFQVLQEFYVNVARKWPAARGAAREEVRDLLAWRPVETNANVLELGWKIQDRYGLSFWDSMVVAAARTASCEYLLSEDFQEGQDLDGVRIVSPFQTDPQAIL